MKVGELVDILRRQNPDLDVLQVSGDAVLGFEVVDAYFGKYLNAAPGRMVVGDESYPNDAYDVREAVFIEVEA